MPSELSVGEGGWPFFWGALGLAAVSLAFLLTTRGFLGVSGSYRRLVEWRRERERDRTEALAARDLAAQDLEALMLAETLAEFGPEALAAMEAEPAVKTETKAAEGPAIAPRLPASMHAVFLASLVVGGLLGALSRGSFGLGWAMGDITTRFGAASPLVLVAGGVLVGFGTTMSGGCTSGHGLSGASRLQPGSLVAVAIFFSTGAVVAHLLGGA